MKLPDSLLMTSQPVNSEETEERIAHELCKSWGYQWDPCENGCDQTCDCLGENDEGEPYDDRPSRADFRKAAHAIMPIVSPPVRETLPGSDAKDSNVQRIEAEIEGLLKEYTIGVRQEMVCKVTPSELSALKDKVRDTIFTRYWSVCVLKGQCDMYNRLTALPPETGS